MKFKKVEACSMRISQLRKKSVAQGVLHAYYWNKWTAFVNLLLTKIVEQVLILTMCKSDQIIHYGYSSSQLINCDRLDKPSSSTEQMHNEVTDNKSECIAEESDEQELESQPIRQSERL